MAAYDITSCIPGLTCSYIWWYRICFAFVIESCTWRNQWTLGMTNKCCNNVILVNWFFLWSSLNFVTWIIHRCATGICWCLNFVYVDLWITCSSSFKQLVHYWHWLLKYYLQFQYRHHLNWLHLCALLWNWFTMHGLQNAGWCNCGIICELTRWTV